MRFDTRFYLASLPANQRPLERSEEVTDSVWINASGALARARAAIFLSFPQPQRYWTISLRSAPGMSFALGFS
jgi:hypothetical protein